MLSTKIHFKNIFLNFIGAICAMLFLIFIILTSPVYLYRLFVIFLAKLIRSDLGEIVKGQDSALLNDYFSSKPSRSNLIVTWVFDGHLTCKELQSLIIKRWIQKRNDSRSGDLTYKKFQQFPVKWLGFGFWKNVAHRFSIDNHVEELYGEDTEITEDQISNICEKMLNTRLPDYQSPWKFYIIENYKNSKMLNLKTDENKLTSAVILKYHHILADGYGITTALFKGLFDSNYSESNTNLKPLPGTPNTNVWKNFQYFVTFPIKAFIELSYYFSHYFRYNPLKIGDDKKAWNQIAVKSETIPVQVIKDIKDSVGVSFTGVLLSAVSMAIQKTAQDFTKQAEIQDHIFESALFMSILPDKNRHLKEILTNSIAAAIFDLPIENKCIHNKLDQIRKIESIWEKSKNSVIAQIGWLIAILLGSHCYPVAKFFSENKTVPIALTNFPGVTKQAKLNGKLLIRHDFIVGGFSGETGIVASVIGLYNQDIRIGITAERGLFTKAQGEQLMKYVMDEIQDFHDLVKQQ